MNDEVIYDQGLSDCCGALIYSEIGICSACKEHCEPFEEEKNGKNN